MTLEDFFTLTEMNNGLTAPSRITELMALLEKDRGCIVKNAAESTRQWSVVASAIAATENKECLDLFIQLDGLHFVSKWLKDAQKFGDDKIDSFGEELTTHLLQAIEKLDLDCEKLVASEIWTTVQKLFEVNSSKVQEKARALFQTWKSKIENNPLNVGIDKTGDVTVDEAGKRTATERGNGVPETYTCDVSVSRETSVNTKDHDFPVPTSDVIHPDQVESTKDLDRNVNPSESGSPTVAMQDRHETRTEFQHMESSNNGSLSDKLVVHEEPKMSKSRSINSSSDDIEDTKAVTELSSQRNSIAREKSSCDEVLSCIDPDGKGVNDGGSSSNRYKPSRAFVKERTDFSRYMLSRSLSRIGDDGKTNTFDNHPANNYTFHNKPLDSGRDRAGRKSNVEIDYGIVDPLEVARQVAIEVEREVVHSREPSCSSSEMLPESNTRQANSPNSPSNSVGVVNETKLPVESSPTQEESASSSEEDLNAELADTPQDMATSQVTEAVEEEKGLCNLDLNQEVTLEDSERSRNHISAPVSVVSASRAAAVPALPNAPLQFEGNLGWKGSAVTSAFRPASKQRQGFLDFDLNVAENTAGESSAETSSRKSEHLALDLNHSSEDSGLILDWRIGQFFPQHHNRPQSSLSSKQQQQQHTRSINLNDQPSHHNDSSANTYLSPLSQNFKGANSDETVISIMGTRIEVNQRDFISQTPNGRIPELAFDVNLHGAGNFLNTPYVNSSTYRYNNIAHGPSTAFSSIHGSVGHIPYMVDSRGQHVFPQIVGSAPAAFSQPPFVLNMNNSAPSNGAGPSRSSFDLNSGMLMESGSKDPSGFGLFLNSAQARSVDEQLRPNIGGKRKEPENGWEHYPFKHYTPPWKQS